MSKYCELIDKERVKRDWTFYKLAAESGISQGTITQWFSRKSVPTLQALEKICDAFGLTLGELFTQNALVELTEERKILFDKWSHLTKVQKSAVLSVMDGYLQN